MGPFFTLVTQNTSLVLPYRFTTRGTAVLDGTRVHLDVPSKQYQGDCKRSTEVRKHRRRHNFTAVDPQAYGSKTDRLRRFSSGYGPHRVATVVWYQPQDKEQHDTSRELEITLHTLSSSVLGSKFMSGCKSFNASPQIVSAYIYSSEVQRLYNRHYVWSVVSQLYY